MTGLGVYFPPPIRLFLRRIKQALFYSWLERPWTPESYPSLELSLKTLRNAGFRPERCLDVGAYHGEWAKFFHTIFPQTRILMIEAQESKRDLLAQLVAESRGLLHTEIALLGPAEGREVVFHEMATGSSVLEEQGHIPRTTTKKISRTLDSVVASIPGFQQGADFIKLDVQGYELEVLKGASHLLTRCQAVLMEASFLPINSGCPLVCDVIAFMHERRFRLVDFCSLIRRKDGVVWQTDLLFLREDSPFLPIPKLTPENWY